MTKNSSLKILKNFLPLSCILFLMLNTASVSAQQAPAIQKIYAEFEAGGTNYHGSHYSVGLKGIWKNNWIMSFNFRSIDMESKNMPTDFDPGYTAILFIPIPNSTPHMDMNIVSIEGGKKFNGGRNTWFSTTAGLSLVSADQLKFSRITVDPSWNLILFGEKYANYNHSIENKTTVGASIKADFNWAFASFAGLGAGVFANFNSIQSPIGYNIKLIVGKTNREKRKKN